MSPDSEHGDVPEPMEVDAIQPDTRRNDSVGD